MDKKHYNCFTYQLKQSRGQRKTTKNDQSNGNITLYEKAVVGVPQKKNEKKSAQRGSIQ